MVKFKVLYKRTANYYFNLFPLLVMFYSFHTIYIFKVFSTILGNRKREIVTYSPISTAIFESKFSKQSFGFSFLKLTKFTNESDFKEKKNLP